MTGFPHPKQPQASQGNQWLERLSPHQLRDHPWSNMGRSACYDVLFAEFSLRNTWKWKGCVYVCVCCVCVCVCVWEREREISHAYVSLSVFMSTHIACYSLNVCVPLKFICWNPTPKDDAIRRWTFGKCWGDEGGISMSGISALTKKTPQSTLAPSHHAKDMLGY